MGVGNGGSPDDRLAGNRSWHVHAVGGVHVDGGGHLHMLGHNGGGLVASGDGNRGGGRHLVDGVGHHSAGGVVVGTSGRVGGGSHDVGGDPVAGGSVHLGAGVCQLGPDASAGQDEGKCDKRLHCRHKLPQVTTSYHKESATKGLIPATSYPLCFSRAP